MVNNAVLIGRLTRDIEVKYTQGGKAVASFSLAVDRDYKDKNGNKETDFINCVLWGKPAETLAQYCGKGSMIGVTGRIQTRNYENQQGDKVYITEVVVKGFPQMLGGGSGQKQPYNQQPANNGYNQGANNGYSQPAPSGEDLPF